MRAIKANHLVLLRSVSLLVSYETRSNWNDATKEQYNCTAFTTLTHVYFYACAIHPSAPPPNLQKPHVIIIHVPPKINIILKWNDKTLIRIVSHYEQFCWWYTRTPDLRPSRFVKSHLRKQEKHHHNACYNNVFLTTILGSLNPRLSLLAHACDHWLHKNWFLYGHI